MSVENVLHAMEKVLQSNSSYLSQERFMVNFHHVQMPKGEGRVKQDL